MNYARHPTRLSTQTRVCTATHQREQGYGGPNTRFGADTQL
jgi:hypothetical protein